MTVNRNLQAFAWGVAVVLVAHTLLIEVGAQSGSDEKFEVCVSAEGVMRETDGACGPGQRRVTLKQPEVEQPCEQKPADLSGLRERVAALESKVANQPQSSRAIAPFEVVNEAGIRVFSVTGPTPGDDMASAEIFNDTGTRVAVMAANLDGGSMSVMSGAGRPSKVAEGNTVSAVSATIESFRDYHGVTVDVGTTRRLDLGRLKEGRYGLAVFASTGKMVAGLGESEAGSGVALVFDAAGDPRVRLSRNAASAGGLAAVLDAAGHEVALLSGNGQGGSGLLQLRNGADVVMVEAGVLESGIGAVRAGPGAFQHGLHFIGLPASYIEGKR